MGRKPKDIYKKDRQFHCRVNYMFEKLLDECVELSGGVSKSDTVYEALLVYHKKLEEDKKKKNYLFY